VIRSKKENNSDYKIFGAQVDWYTVKEILLCSYGTCSKRSEEAMERLTKGQKNAWNKVIMIN
jgi:hypothetical protein